MKGRVPPPKADDFCETIFETRHPIRQISKPTLPRGFSPSKRVSLGDQGFDINKMGATKRESVFQKPSYPPRRGNFARAWVKVSPLILSPRLQSQPPRLGSPGVCTRSTRVRGAYLARWRPKKQAASRGRKAKPRPEHACPAVETTPKKEEKHSKLKNKFRFKFSVTKFLCPGPLASGRA